MPASYSLKQLKKAISFQQRNQVNKAEKIYKTLLEENDENVDVLHFYGLLLSQKGQHKQGIELILAAIALKPAYTDAYINLGNIFMTQGQYDNAQKCYGKALSLEPDRAVTAFNLGTLLKYKGQLEKSEQLLQNVVNSLPEMAEAHMNLANLQKTRGKLTEALASHLHALQLKPELHHCYGEVVRLCYRLGKPEKALDTFEKWREADPHNPSLTHMYAAFKGNDTPRRASDAYVATTFDAYADSFEASLAELDYSAPKQLGQELKTLLPEQASLTILDAGCGTGLSAPYLKPYAKKLLGMDLSPGMLKHARVKQAYDRLICKDIESGINDFTDYFDLITSMDVLIYLGDLDALFFGARNALSEGGYFIFTVEQTDEADSYRLDLSGRYAHSEAYLRAYLKKNDLLLKQIKPIVIRKELENDVAGLLVVAQKNSATKAKR